MTEFEQTLLAELSRIADSLEGINDKLEECTGYIPPRYPNSTGCHFLRIAGQVYTE